MTTEEMSALVRGLDFEQLLKLRSFTDTELRRRQVGGNAEALDEIEAKDKAFDAIPLGRTSLARGLVYVYRGVSFA